MPACASSSPSWGWSSASGRPDTEAAEAEQTEDDWTARFQSDQVRGVYSALPRLLSPCF